MPYRLDSAGNRLHQQTASGWVPEKVSKNAYSPADMYGGKLVIMGLQAEA
jgi:hypothetical protein